MSQLFKSYVINLEKRNDRLEKFKTMFEKYGPGSEELPLEVIKAVDGTEFNDIESLKSNISDMNDIPNSIVKFLECENDYNDNPRIFACALSHIITWKKIAEGTSYGIIFEDDINFREDSLFKKNYKKYFDDIVRLDHYNNKHKEHNENNENKEHFVVYLGIGDVLPIHINIRSESLMRAQEKSHIKDFINDSIGTPKEKNAFIFDWFGAFSYCISPKTAQFLLDNLEKNGLHNAIDVHIKRTLMPYVVWPLLIYHDRLETCDSDIVGRKRSID
jgi:GR25 family glycosyltransferase involved in LPS biosynthesis